MTTTKKIKIAIITILFTALVLGMFKTKYEIDDTIFKIAHFIFSVVFIYAPVYEFYNEKITNLLK
jgi:hypothetical protein